ncbi:hypothetical protein Tco_0138115 [Tanacetum coccineum]
MSDKHPYKTNHSTPFPVDEWDIRYHITYTGSTSNQNIPNNDLTPFLLEHSELGEKDNISESPKLRPFRPRPCDYSFVEWLKVKIGHTNIYDSDREIVFNDREIVFNEWILDSFDVEEEYAKEIGNSYSRRFDEYKQVFDNEIEHLLNECTLRIGKKGVPAARRLHSSTWATKWFKRLVAYAKCNCDSYESKLGENEPARDGDFLNFSAGLLHFICSKAKLKGVSYLNSTLPVYFISLMFNRDIIQNK